MKYILSFMLVCFSCACNQLSGEEIKTHHEESKSLPDQQKSNTKTISIPFQSSKWHSLEYSSIPSNQVNFNPQYIDIKVRNSASPLIYPMTDQPRWIKKISIEGSISKLLSISPSTEQGNKNFDDFNLRLGLVLLGQKRLQFHQRVFAADWVKKMFDLAPKDQGIDHIYFLNGVLSPTLLNRKRTHPLSEYIKEHYIWLMNETGDFHYEHTFEEAQKAGALWIAVDGDDTQSDFDLRIKNITLFQ